MKQSLLAAFFIGSAQVSKILFGLLFMKITAIYIGPDGLGRIGHFMSLVTFLVVLSGGGIQTGIVKYVSEYKKEKIKLVKFIEDAFSYSFIFSILIFFLLVIFSDQLSLFLFGSQEYNVDLIAVGVIQFIIAYNKVVLSIFNGLKKNKVFFYAQLVGNLLSLPLIWWIISKYGFRGALYAIVINQIVMFLFLFFYRRKEFKKSFKKPNLLLINSRLNYTYKSLFSFTLMALTSAVVFPLVEITIRQMIIEAFGYADAGIWQALARISNVYIGFFSLFLSYYFVPTVSPEKNINNLQKHIFVYSIVLGIVFIFFGCILYFLKDFIIPLLLSEEFSNINKYIGLQLIGDFFKIISFVIGFVFVAKAVMAFYIFVEVFQGLMLIGITKIFFENLHTFKSFYFAYALENIIYFVFMVISIFIYLKKRVERF